MRGMMKTLMIAAALGGVFLLARKRAGNRQSIPPPPLTTRQYHDRLANHLEVALAHGNKPLWDEVSEECRNVGREDLPEHMRKKWPEWAERIDSA
jgi:hypothetical protein